MTVKVRKNGVILLPANDEFSVESKLEVGNILLYTLSNDKRCEILKKFSGQSLNDKQIKAHGSLCRVEPFNPRDFDK